MAFCSKIEASAIRTPFGPIPRNFFGASVGTAGEEVFACAPRYNSKDYWQVSDVTGACFKMSSYQRRLDLSSNQRRLDFDKKYELPKGRIQHNMMGHSVVDDGRGGLVIGIPMARTFSE